MKIYRNLIIIFNLLLFSCVSIGNDEIDIDRAFDRIDSYVVYLEELSALEEKYILIFENTSDSERIDELIQDYDLLLAKLRLDMEKHNIKIPSILLEEELLLDDDDIPQDNYNYEYDAELNSGAFTPTLPQSRQMDTDNIPAGDSHGTWDEYSEPESEKTKDEQGNMETSDLCDGIMGKTMEMFEIGELASARGVDYNTIVKECNLGFQMPVF